MIFREAYKTQISTKNGFNSQFLRFCCNINLLPRLTKICSSLLIGHKGDFKLSDAYISRIRKLELIGSLVKLGDFTAFDNTSIRAAAHGEIVDVSDYLPVFAEYLTKLVNEFKQRV